MMTPTISPPSTNRAARRRLVTFILLLLIGILPRLVVAQEAESVKARYDKAAALYQSGQYERAIEEFQAVYELKQVPTLLFNIAQAQRKAKHFAKAVDLYTRFLSTNPKEELKTEAEKYLAESQAGVADEEKANKEIAEKTAAAKALADKTAADKAVADQAASAKVAAELQRKQQAKRPLNIAKWVVGGAGIVMAAIGAVLVGLDGRPTCDRGPGQVLCPQQLDTIVPGAALLGVGIAAVGTSAVLFGVDYKQTRDGAQRATATVAMRF